MIQRRTASYIKHGQHLNRPAAKSTALFVANPDHPGVLANLAFAGEPLRLCELTDSAAPRGGLLHPPSEGHVETNGGVDPNLLHDPGINPTAIDHGANLRDETRVANDARMRENKTHSLSDQAYAKTLSVEPQGREPDTARRAHLAGQLERRQRGAANSKLMSREAAVRKQPEEDAAALSRESRGRQHDVDEQNLLGSMGHLQGTAIDSGGCEPISRVWTWSQRQAGGWARAICGQRTSPISHRRVGREHTQGVQLGF